MRPLLSWMGPSFANLRERGRFLVSQRYGRVVVVGLALGLLLSPGWARLWPEPALPPDARSEATASSAAAVPPPELQASQGAAAIAEDWFAAQSGPNTPEQIDASSFECLLEPSDSVSLGSPITGRIAKVLVERSQFVEQGQVVVELESTVEAAALEVARARAAASGSLRSRQASAALEASREQRAQQLFERQAVSLDVREEVEAQARVARAEVGRAREEQNLANLELQQAQAALERRTIRTPLSGVVVERLLSAGEVVDEETILRIARVDPLWVEALLPAAEFGKVRVGMRGAVTPEVPGDQVHTALVVMVDRVIDPASGTFSVRLELPNPEHRIPSGLHCQTRFLSE